MIRKFIIVVLTLAAGANSVAWFSTKVVEADKRGMVWNWGPCEEHAGPTTCVTAIKGGSVVVCLPVKVPEFVVRAPGGFEVRARLNTTSYYPSGTRTRTVEKWGILLSGPTQITALILIAYPTIAFIRGPLRRHRRRRKGECIGCGYDLTGNESGVCPECGSKTDHPVSIGRPSC